MNKVVLAEDVLCGRVVSGQRVVIVGGGLVGLETALFVSRQGKHVTVTEQLENVAGDVGPIVKIVLMEEINKSNVTVLAGVRACKATEDGLDLQQGERIIHLPADTVILAVGYRSVENQLSGRLNISPVRIGDAACVRNALFAIHDGFLAGMEV